MTAAVPAMPKGQVERKSVHVSVHALGRWTKELPYSSFTFILLRLNVSREERSWEECPRHRMPGKICCKRKEIVSRKQDLFTTKSGVSTCDHSIFSACFSRDKREWVKEESWIHASTCSKAWEWAICALGLHSWMTQHLLVKWKLASLYCIIRFLFWL